MNKTLLLLLAFAAPFLFATAAENPPALERAKLATVLAEKGFWDKQPDTIWNAREVAALDDLADSGDSPAVRLRATKLLIDVAGGGRATAKELPIVAAGFRYIEQHLQDPAILRMLAAPRMTHYTVSSQADGSVWFLLELARSPDGGGLNFRWDAEKKQMELVKSWGSLAQK
jgi:hypothetical protein